MMPFGHPEVGGKGIIEHETGRGGVSIGTSHIVEPIQPNGSVVAVLRRHAQVSFTPADMDG